MKKTRWIVSLSLLLACLVFGSAPSVLPESEKKVAILPFVMNAERDLSFLREGIMDMLASRLYWKGKVTVIEKAVVKKAVDGHQGPIDVTYATEVGRKLGADYVLFGSMTLFGDSVSLDATMADTAGKEEPVTVFTQTKGMETVIPEVNKFAQMVNAKIFGRAYADAEVAMIPQAPAPATVSGTAPGAATAGTRVSPLNPQFTRYHQVQVQDASFWKSQTFKAELQGMDVGDVDGDGKNELVLIEGIDISVHRFQNGALVKVASHTSHDRHRFIAVDVADINNNGRAEIFASRVSGLYVTSTVLEMEGGNLRVLVKSSPWFYRIMEWPGRGRILVGQGKIAGSYSGYVSIVKYYFERGIFPLKWNGSEYVKAEEAPLLDLPNVYIYNFAVGDLTGDGKNEIVVIGRHEALRIVDPTGEEIYKASEPYGGTLNFIITNPDATSDLDKEFFYIPARILIADLDRNGRNEVIVNQNKSSTGGYTERLRAFSDGKMVSLTWTGLALDPNWESRKLSGCLSDFQIKDLDNDGNPDLVVALIQERGTSIFKDAKSVVVSYSLATKAGQ